jgi:hypothetical protein
MVLAQLVMSGCYMEVMKEVEQSTSLPKGKRSGKVRLLSQEAKALAATNFL